MVAAIVITLLTGFVLGIVFKHYVLSELTEVKDHITSEVTKLRNEIADKIR